MRYTSRRSFTLHISLPIREKKAMTGDEIRALRKETGWTLEDMAKITGYHLNTLSRYQLGQLSIPQLLEIFVLLMCDKKNRRVVEKYL
jgi:DNA-binding transcriptional regulator YiaG